MSQSQLPTGSTSPVVYGLAATQASQGSYLEATGLGPAAGGNIAYITGAIASTAVPIPAVAVNGTIPLGFAPGSLFACTVNGAYLPGQAVAPGAAVVFRESDGNGTIGQTLEPIVASDLSLTSPEVPSFNQALHFDGANIGIGPLGDGEYTTNAFTLPFTASGLHSLTATIGDASGRISTTTFDVLVLTPTDSAAMVQITDINGNPLSGATATITNSLGVTAQTTADSQGVVVLFAAPGPQVVTATDSATSPIRTGTLQVTLTAGSATVLNSTGSPLSMVVQ